MAAEAPSSSFVPLEAYLADGWYPGWQQRTGDSHYLDLLRPFQKHDESELWHHENLHWSRGIVPAAFYLLEDIIVWGTQLQAELLPLPPGRGIRGRLAGVHVYGGQLGVDSAWQRDTRTALMQKKLGPYLQNFSSIWQGYVEELKNDFDHFVGIDYTHETLEQLQVHLQDALAYHKRSWAIHFEVMYALLANYVAFYELNRALGLDPVQAATYLSGERTTFMDADEHLWQLSRRARELGIVDTLLEGELPMVRSRLEPLPHGRIWWSELEQFLKTFGYRLDELACIELQPWIDDPTPALANIRTMLGATTEHDFQAAHQRMLDQRDTAVEGARSRLGGGTALRSFDDGLTACRAANFAWWNDEHNFHIDQRSHIPTHWVTREIGRRLADGGQLSGPDDVLWLFTPELAQALQGNGPDWPELRALVQPRKDYYAEWSPKAPDMPPLLGTIPESVADPIMLEIFGLYPSFLATLREGGPPRTEVRGLPASRGVAEGTARVLSSVTQIHELRAGDILVCKSSTPDWTPIFGTIKACVCDGGGSLSHAAIVSREYGIPCVVGTATATRSIRTGDHIRVDGTNGIVTVLSPESA